MTSLEADVSLGAEIAAESVIVPDSMNGASGGPKAADQDAPDNGSTAPGDSVGGAVDNPSAAESMTAPAEQRPARASVYPEAPLPAEFVKLVRELEGQLGMRVLCLLQPSHGPRFAHLDGALVRELARRPEKLPNEPIAVLLDSPGGYARDAYQLARLLQKRCGSYHVVIPRWAKSAATLFSLGAETIRLGISGELGPLDAQMIDHDRELPMSALDEVQAVERLQTLALEAADTTMFVMLQRTGKRVEALLPIVLHFAAEVVSPLISGIDAVHFTQVSRVLKVAEEYASRLLRPTYGDEAATIASRLVSKYPDHEFVIDETEAADLGLSIAPLDDQLNTVVDGFYPMICDGLMALGFVEDVGDEEEEK